MTAQEPTPQNPDTLWHYWFDLKTAAKGRKWEVLRHKLAYEPDKPLTAHPFVAEVFHAAADAGESDILETLFERGFTVDPEDAEKTLTRLAMHHTAGAAGSVRAIRAHMPAVDTAPAVCAAAAAGRLDALRALDAAGVDIRSGDSAFFLALYKGHPAAMNYLYEKGAGLYHPAVIAAQYDRRGELPPEKADIALGVYHDLVAMNNAFAADIYKAAGGPPQNVNALREIVADADGRPFTRLQLAVRAGRWDDIARAARQDKSGDRLNAADFLASGGDGLRALDVLAAAGGLAGLFDAALWYRAPEEAAKLHKEIETYRAYSVCDFPRFTAAMQRLTLEDFAPDAGAFRLARRKGPKP